MLALHITSLLDFHRELLLLAHLFGKGVNKDLGQPLVLFVVRLEAAPGVAFFTLLSVNMHFERECAAKEASCLFSFLLKLVEPLGVPEARRPLVVAGGALKLDLHADTIATFLLTFLSIFISLCTELGKLAVHAVASEGGHRAFLVLSNHLLKVLFNEFPEVICPVSHYYVRVLPT